MGWAVGFDPNWQRDVGYGVPSICDHPDCSKIIDRGLGYVCGGDVFGGSYGCGLYFCSNHLTYADMGERSVQVCEHCAAQDGLVYTPTPDTDVWVYHKLYHPSWEQWRTENPAEVARLQARRDTW